MAPWALELRRGTCVSICHVLCWSSPSSRSPSSGALPALHGHDQHAATSLCALPFMVSIFLLYYRAHFAESICSHGNHYRIFPGVCIAWAVPLQLDIVRMSSRFPPS